MVHLILLFLDALASLRPRRPRIATDNLRIQTWILRLSPHSFQIVKITTESISENRDSINTIEDYPDGGMSGPTTKTKSVLKSVNKLEQLETMQKLKK